MTFRTADLIHETTTSTGVGDIALAGAIANRFAFNSIPSITIGDVFYYAIFGGGQFEVGLGTYSAANTLTRTAGGVYSGSGGAGALVSFSAGTKDVVLTAPSNRLLQISDDGDFIVPASSALPTVPVANQLSVFAKSIGGRLLLSQMGPSGLDTAFQPHLGGNRAIWWQSLGNTTTVPITTGIAAATGVGTTTARTVATTNIATRTKRLGYTTTAATAGLLCGHYFSPAQFSTGDGAGLGGFNYRERFFTSDASAVSGARMFVGMSSSTSVPTNVEPNTLTNTIGVAQLSTDNTQFYLCYGGSAAQTAIALGTTVGAPTLVNTVFELQLFAYPSVAFQVGYTLVNLGTGVAVTGTIGPGSATTLPASTTLLAPRAWRCNNATALQAAIDIVSMYIETDQ